MRFGDDVAKVKTVSAVILALLASATAHAGDADRFITKIRLPSGQTAVIAEGDFEARSLGSFSVRLYEAAPPGDETVFFVSGLLQARDGAIDKVMVADVDGDKRPEIIVNVRSVGTGGYLSCHAFAVDENNLVLRASAEGLPPDADPVLTLQRTLQKGVNREGERRPD